jgi:hypothetical protein
VIIIEWINNMHPPQRFVDVDKIIGKGFHSSDERFITIRHKDGTDVFINVAHVLTVTVNEEVL